MSVSGPHGGYRIIEGYRNEFARLSNEETNAVLAAASSRALDGIGAGDLVRSGLEKLAAQRGPGGQATSADPEILLIDAKPWSDEADAPILQRVLRSAARHYLIRITLVGDLFVPGPVPVTTLPLGLVNKLSRWYLVHGFERVSVVAADRILSMEETDSRRAPPSGFRLDSFWDSWCLQQRQWMGQYRACLEVSADEADAVRRYLTGGSALLLMRPLPAVAGARSVRLECRFDSYEDARVRILGLGGAARVIEPDALRRGVVDYARRVVANYRDGDEA